MNEWTFIDPRGAILNSWLTSNRSLSHPESYLSILIFRAFQHKHTFIGLISLISLTSTRLFKHNHVFRSHGNAVGNADISQITAVFRL